MQKILAGVRQFQEHDFPKQREFFERLAEKTQQPRALFITCADSRVHPNLITRTEPGDLFLIRNAGNLIPPYGGSFGGEVATVEYSVAVLGIRNIIVCGHSQCGAMTAMLKHDSLDDLPAVRKWFLNADATLKIVRTKYPDLEGDELLLAATEENILVQMNNLSTHPQIAARLSTGDIQMFGWYYDIGTGQVLQFNQASGQFEPLNGKAYAAAPLPVRAVETALSRSA